MNTNRVQLNTDQKENSRKRRKQHRLGKPVAQWFQAVLVFEEAREAKLKITCSREIFFSLSLLRNKRARITVRQTDRGPSTRTTVRQTDRQSTIQTYYR